MRGLWEAEILQRMANNIRGKFAYFVQRTDGMSVHQLGNVQYVDCEKESDTFNTVFGMPVDEQEITSVTEYYRRSNKPAAWWFAQPPEAFVNILQQLGWTLEECDTGMYYLLPESLSPLQYQLSHIIECDTPDLFNDFGNVLSSIFEESNPSEAENVRSVYYKIGAEIPHLNNPMILLVGYEVDEPVTTAAVFISSNDAGIFDIATRPDKRNRGYGSAIFQQALICAQQKGASLCLLQTSPDGFNIYQRTGFTCQGSFEIWSLSQK